MTTTRTEDPAWRRRRIMGLALPIIGGMVSQNLLNLVDTAMVGQLGDAALAATGVGGFVFFMGIAAMMGFSSGVQAMSSRRVGEGRHDETAEPLNAGLIAAIAFGLPMSLALVLITPQLFPLLNGDPAVYNEGIPYLQARLSTLALGGMGLAFRGFFNGTDRPVVYMRTLLITHAVNIVLNALLIFGLFGAPKLGVLGAGIGSAVATFVGAVVYGVQALAEARDKGFLRRRPERAELRQLVRLSVPASAQQLLFAAGLTVMFGIIGMVSTRATAAASVLVNVMLVAILPSVGMGLAAATLVGQSLGRGDPEGAKRWGWQVARLGFLWLGALGLLGALLAEPILGFFLHDPETLAVAVPPLRIFASVIGLDAIGLVLMNALLGAGYNRVAMQVSVLTQWGLFLPVAYGLVAWGGFGLLEIWIANAGYRLIQAGIYAAIWRRGAWQRVKI